jgi:membrane-bound lytic murein transglycosylase B
MLARYRSLLRQLLKEFGVPPQYLLAFWGLETNYGSYLGYMPVLDSLATLACDERRSEFFTGEFLEALRMVDAKTVAPADFLGSWAGAVGNMQFMPSTYRRYALDADGDGRADLWRSIPDALTSAAHYLNQLGWERELRWGREVILPKHFDYGQATLAVKRDLKEWRTLGITMANGEPLPDYSVQASILVPAGHTGPAFIVYDNFAVIMKWNRSYYYGIAVGRLADRINGAGELHQPPPDQPRLTLPEIEALQTALNGAGFAAGKPDGILGSVTREAVRAYQQAKGLIADGYPSADVFKALGVAELR